MAALKPLLFAQYGGLEHGRIRKRGDLIDIVIDDRGEGDFDDAGQLVFWFCTLRAEVDLTQRITVFVEGVLPVSAALRDWVLRRLGSLDEGEKLRLQFSFEPGQQQRLDELAVLIHAMTARNRWFPFPFLRHTCPRTARSLYRFRATLDTAWG